MAQSTWSARLWCVEVVVLWRGLADRRRLRRHSCSVKLLDGRLQLPKLGAELLEKLCLALLDGDELLLHELDARQQPMFHRFHRHNRVREGRF